MTSLINQVQNDYKDALKAGDRTVVSVLRLLISDVRNKEIERRARGENLVEDDVLGIVQKEIKARKESIEAYKKGQREDLVKQEKKELIILQKYLPEQLSKEELEQVVQEVVEETKADGLKDMGKVIGEVMKKVKGRAEGRVVSEMVKQTLEARS